MTNNKSQKIGKENMNKDVHEPVTKCDQSKEVVTNCDNNQFVVANSLQSVDIESLIRNIRGQQVMLDSDLAMLYGVETRRLNEQVKRNIERFPDDFMFQLTRDELNSLRSQFATSKQSAIRQDSIWTSQFATSNYVKMGLRRAPYAFTRNGIGMLTGSLARVQTPVPVRSKAVAPKPQRSFD